MTRLILFDVDGTLVDSQGSIVAAMTAAFDSVDMTAPERGDILSIVGLSLDQAMARLAPAQPATVRAQMVQTYKTSYNTQRTREGSAAGSPMYPGARAMLDHLTTVPGTVLGVATGKSKRGLDALIDAQGLETVFVTRQVADFHPSKPHPSMVLTAMAEAGAEPANTVMIGDTRFDMDMARAAGVAAIGVSWGYHDVADLRGLAHCVIDRFEDLPGALEQVEDKAQ